MYRISATFHYRSIQDEIIKPEPLRKKEKATVK